MGLTTNPANELIPKKYTRPCRGYGNKYILFCVGYLYNHVGTLMICNVHDAIYKFIYKLPIVFFYPRFSFRFLCVLANQAQLIIRFPLIFECKWGKPIYII